jgi:FkbM family methyltransferase
VGINNSIIMHPIKNIQEKHGYKFCEFALPDGNNSSVYTFTDEERVRERMYYPYLKSGMKVLDVGAGYGSYTLPALVRGCKVTAITPPTEYVEELRENVRINGWLDNNRFKLLDTAVYSQVGLVNIQTREYVRWVHQKRDKQQEGGEFVHCTTIDKIYRNGVDFIKMDVEGFEVEALYGAKCTIARNKPIILVENHQFIDGSLQKRVRELIIDSWKLGYTAHSETYHQISHTLFTPQDLPS